jgi:hypothetical protein
MSAITDLIGGIVSGLGETAVKIRTAITGIDPAKQAEITELTLNLQAQAAKAVNDTILAQAEIDKQEAASTNVFIAGWRPFIGWICGIAIGYNFLVIPLGGLILKALKVDFPMPALDMSELWTLVTGMLGLGTMRTVEKIQGAAGNH